MKIARRLVVLAGLLAAVPVAAAEGPAIAAAADLNAALPEVAAAFTRATGRRVRLVFGSSGNFTQQIRNGAPFEVFLSADEAYVAALAAAGRTEGAGVLYAIGRIGLFVPRGSAVRGIDDLAAAARDGRLTRFAMPNPAHAPYGRAAREALQKAGAWTAVAPRLVLGENAAQATQFATSGSVQAAIIPLALASTPAVRAAGRFVAIDAGWHAPLRQRVVLVKGAGATAREFYRFVQAPAARAILRRHGFVVPGDGR